MDANPFKEIKTLLIAMQTEQVAKAEAKLTEYANKQGDLFFQYMISILAGSAQSGLLTQQEQWIKTIAASFVNSYIHSKADDQTLLVSQVLKKILYHPNIKQLDKRCMQKSICKMLSEAQEDLQKQWQHIIRQFLKNKLYYDCAYLLIACFSIAEGVTYAMIRSLITSSFDSIISSLEVNLQNANLLNEMLKMWIVIIDSLRNEQENKEILLFIANNQRLLDLLDLLYQLQAIDGVIACLNPNLYELNLLKYEAAELNKRLLIVSEESLNICQNLMNYSKKNFNRFARTLHILSMQKQIFDTLGCQDLLTTLFSIQILYVSYNPQQISYQTAVGIIQNEIFPLILINDEQREKFQESPEQFNSLTQDCCDKQTFGILKTEGFKLLEILADSIEGAFEYIMTRAIESIKINAGFSQYNNLQQVQVLPLEVSFLILSVLSYGLGNHQEEVSVLKAMLNDNRMKQLAPLEMSRVLTFLAYNYNEIYKQPSEGENWIVFSLNYNAHPTTSYCALDFLSNIIDEYFTESLLDLLLKQVTKCKISLIWQILSKLLKHQFFKISTQGIINIILKIFQRINNQINQLRSNQKNNTLDLINCLNLFSHIIDSLNDEKNQGQNSERINKILTYVWPITQLYQTVIQWDLEDCIVKTTTKIINIIPSIMVQIHQLIPQFISAFKINGYFQKYYLQFFNQFAVKANYVRDQSSLISIFITLKDGLLHNIMSNKAIDTTKNKSSLRLAVANILVVLQNMIANHGNGLLQSNSTEFFNQIGSLCIQLLPKINQQIEKSSSGRIIYSRALNTLFLCHIHLKTDCFYDYLKILKDENIFHGFDTKVFVLCAQKEIFRETDVSAISFLIESLLNIIQKSAQKQQKIKKQKNSKKMKAGVPSQIKRIEQFDKLLKTIDSPFERNTQLSEQVSTLFNSMHSGNEQMFIHLINSLPPQSLQTLKKYVDLDGTSRKKRVYRKVIGIKQGVSEIDVEHTFNSSKKKSKYDNEADEDDNDQDEIGLKRQRVKTKNDKKKRNDTRKMYPSQQ